MAIFEAANCAPVTVTDRDSGEKLSVAFAVPSGFTLAWWSEQPEAVALVNLDSGELRYIAETPAEVLAAQKAANWFLVLDTPES